MYSRLLYTLALGIIFLLPQNLPADQVVRVGVFDNQPIVFKDSHGEISGFAIDVLEGIAKQHDWQLEYHFDSWSNQLSALEQGDIDLLVGIAYSEARAKQFDFTQQTVINNWAVVLQGSDGKISSLQDLTGRKIALMQKSIHSTVFVETMKKFNFPVKVIEAQDYQSAMNKVSGGSADAAVVNRVFSMLHGQEYNVKETGIIFNPVEVRYAAPKGRSADVIAGIDVSITDAKNNSSSFYYVALNKWLGTLSRPINYQWIFWLVIVVVILLALALIYNYLLAKQVRSRTRQLVRSERRYKMAQAAAQIGSWEWNIKTNDIYWSENIPAMFGLEAGEFAGTFEAYLALLEPEARDKVTQAVEDALLNKQAFIVEHKVIWPDGSTHWIAGKGEVQRDAKHEPIRMLGIVYEITARIEAENTLRESEERFRQLAENINAVFWVGTADFKRVLYVSPAYQDIWDRTCESLYNNPLSWLESVHPDDRSQVEEDLKEKVRTAVSSSAFREYRIIRPDNTIRWVSARAYPILNQQGEVYRVVGIAEDVTESRKAELALARSKAEFEAIFNSISDPCVYADADRNIVMTNSAVLNVFGYSESELVGKKTMLLYANRADFEAQGKRQFSKETTIKNANYEMRYRRKDGSTFIGDTLGTKVYDDHGNIIGLLAVIRDVTERHEAEAELQKHRHRLEQLVKERTEEYENINKELEAFSYSVSHDLRAPLRAIDGFSDALREDYEDLLDTTGKEYLNRVRNAAQRMSVLIDDLLHLSRVSRTELEKQLVDISQLVTNVIKQHLETQSAANINYQVQPKLTVQADKQLLEVVINNLIENAIKYTKYTQHPAIEFGCQQQNGDRVFFVKDNGAGFDMRYVSKLFTPFQRLHNPAEFEGTGVGLATVKRIITRHGGKVWAEAKEGQGATFYFTL